MNADRMAAAPTVFREIVVFLPDGGAGDALPLDRAQDFTQALGVGQAHVGTDLLTGAVEIRFLYDPTLFTAAQKYARVNEITCEIDRR